MERWYNIIMNKAEMTKLTVEQKVIVEEAVKLAVKKYRKTLIRLAST
jgi:hypothetical protein